MLAVALVGASLLAACGGDDADDVSADGSSTTAPAADGSTTTSTTVAVGTAAPDVVEVSADLATKPTITLNGLGPVTELYQEDIVVGDGDTITAPGDSIEVQYVGVSLDGTQFDASWDRGETAQFSLDGVIPGWTQGLQGMAVGGRRLLVIPADLAYGDDPSSGRPTGTLVFAIDLVAISDHAPIPLDAVGDGSGVISVTGPLGERPVVALNSAVDVTELVSQDIIVGEGDEVTADSEITVQYLGALLDGTVFDASWDRDAEAATFTLSGLIEGWKQGLVGMRAGGRRLLVVPASLGYGDAGQGPVPPASTLVFVIDVESVG